MRKFFTNPLSALFFAGLLFIILFLGSLFPSDFVLAQVIRFVAITGLLSGLLPCAAWFVWRIRAVYHDEIKGVPDDLSAAARAGLTGQLYIAIALVFVAGAILLSV
ncbi:hypothetical protein DES40_1710 [Litorimonas taeanensis]|uniref:Uncharacterized protein n=1 Tax=Litorimonas taeanensis TaxID=568099 RepID=A0A420WD26_9PROT|nr:hypothetical protein [Litorimonas taeanensis]RKQ68934.1 hypothetical protein DES40_1710 [Litorimonas taeanensis]